MSGPASAAMGRLGRLMALSVQPLARRPRLIAAEERQAVLAQLGTAFSRLPLHTRMRHACPPTGNSLKDTFVYVEANDVSQRHVEGVVVDGERDEDGQWLLDGEFTVFTTDEELVRIRGWGCDVQIQ